MCFSLEASLITSILVYSCTIYLWKRNKSIRDRSNAIFLWIFGSMQTIDLLLWYLSTKENLFECSFTNRVITRIGYYVIISEPWAALAARMYSDKKLCSLLEFIIYFISCDLLPYFTRAFFNKPICDMSYCTQFTPNGHLILGVGIN